MKVHRRWTQTDLNDLRERLSAGENAEAVAGGTGRPLETVLAMMSRLRLRVVAAP